MTAEPAGAPTSRHTSLSTPNRKAGSLEKAVLGHPGLLVIVDLLLGLAVYGLAWSIRTHIELPFTRALLPEERWTEVTHPWVLLVATQAFLPYIFGLYDELRTTRYRELVAFVGASTLVQMAVVTSSIFLSGGATSGLDVQHLFPRSVIVIFSLLNMLALVLWRFYVKTRLKSYVQRVLIVAEKPSSAHEILNEIEKSPWMGLEVVGLLYGESSPDPADGAARSRYPVLGSLEEVDRVITQHEIEQVIVASEPSWKDQVFASMSRQGHASLKIAILPSAYEMVIGKLRHVNIHDTPLLSIRKDPNEPLQRFVKRAFDLGLSALGILLALPILLVISVLIRVTSSGPVFYLQERIGRRGRPFRLIKFRTMVQDAEASGREALAAPNDPRVTPVGRVLRRFRFDEIPQLVNVLKGDMSFIGPRPERPGFVAQFQDEVPGYAERHKVKPGITGLAQVRSFYHTSPGNKLKYDLAYIYNYSFSLDLILLFETIKTVLTRRGS